ncbi:MAG: DNA-directed RNA polymerase subunit alpha [Oligoflexales bacterium]
MHRNWKQLIKPEKLEAVELTDTYGKFVAKPLEKGYGVTIGNSLRRVLLSSVNGSAVVAVRIEGVDHEFSTLTGVREDITDVMLNIKQVSIRYFGEGDTIIRVNKKGPCVVTAGDIETNGDVEILNQEQELCSLNEEGDLRLEMIVRRGRGYQDAERNRERELPIGFIAIDSIFAPVRRVAYNVSNARVGQDTDYDKLTLELWGSGAVRPDDAVAYAAQILRDQLGPFINFDEADYGGEVSAVDETSEDSEPLNDHLFKTVDALELSVRAANCLENANIKYIGELVTKSENEMLKTKNFGRKSLNEIKDLLVEMGLSLGMKIEGFDPTTLRASESKEDL